MFSWVRQVLDVEQRRQVLDYLRDGACFADGKSTAGYRAKQVKHNQQLSRSDAQKKVLQGMLISALEKNDDFRCVAFPKRIQRPLFSRYREGMSYGRHIDDALMGKSNAIRTDLAVTVFISEPTDYEGGELIVHTSLGEQLIKLPAGDAIVYPASTLHQVAPVTEGERLAAVSWVQSYIRDPFQRELLGDLNRIRRSLDKSQPGAEATDLAHKVYANLLRSWAEV